MWGKTFIRQMKIAKTKGITDISEDNFVNLKSYVEELTLMVKTTVGTIKYNRRDLL